MAIQDFLRRAKGAVTNAVVWGAAWFGLTVATVGVLRTTGVIHAPGFWLFDAIFIGMRVGIMGGLAGGAFSALIGFLYRGRRLSQINWVRFGLGGGIVAGLFVPAFMILASLLTGGGLPTSIAEDVVLAALFGAITAGGSMWLAQRADAASIGGPDRHERLASGAEPFRATDFGHRTRASVRYED
ncbi:MAG TPA: hypothetical protein VFQ39_17835 [Longimicrobium sp.]|nr:hypothetical protein [Longimicrobium sp.]